MATPHGMPMSSGSHLEGRQEQERHELVEEPPGEQEDEDLLAAGMQALGSLVYLPIASGSVHVASDHCRLPCCAGMHAAQCSYYGARLLLL
jgi:hypothetical protein